MANPTNIIRNPATQSAVHDATKARELASAEQRRAKLDQMRATVAQQRAAPEPGVASWLHTNVLGGIGTHASIVIKITHKDKSTKTYEICELSVDSEGLTLIAVCPSCLFRHGRSVSESHITMRSWHRRFTLDERGAGELWVNPQNQSEIVQLAGTIHTHEPQTCPVCSFRFEIEASRDPGESGLSVMREV